jgi:DNA-binding PadR family transcriptional regulator
MHGMKRQNGRHPGGRGRFGGMDEGHGMFGNRRGGGGHAGGGLIGGGRRGKRFSGEELRLMVLALLNEQAPQHGYQLIRSFADKSGEAYAPSPGVLYPLLTLLQDMGLALEAASDGSRRSYSLTETGRAEVAAGREAITAAFARLATMAAEAQRTDAGPVRRAMMNLRTAAVQRMGKDGADDQLGFAIAAILDEAAQKIERL